MYTLIGELDDGNSVGFTHVDSELTTGWAAANTVVGFVGISGIEQLDAMGMHPSHAHTAWNSGVVRAGMGTEGTSPRKISLLSTASRWSCATHRAQSVQ